MTQKAYENNSTLFTAFSNLSHAYTNKDGTWQFGSVATFLMVITTIRKETAS